MNAVIAPVNETTRLQTVIFDLASTLVDFGSRILVVAFQRLFDEFGVAVNGNAVGLSHADWHTLPDSKQIRLRVTGGHYVIDSVAGLPAILDHIEQRLAAGERP